MERACRDLRQLSGRSPRGRGGTAALLLFTALPIIGALPAVACSTGSRHLTSESRCFEVDHNEQAAPAIPGADLRLIILSPADDARFVFDESYPGRLRIQATARTVPRNPEFEREITWSAEPIGEVVPKISPERGPVVEITYEHLPQNNEDFGNFAITTAFKNQRDQVTVRAFFARDARNNPGGIEPNWFYYWSQIDAIRDLAIGDIVLSDARAGGRCARNHVLGFYVRGDSEIHICHPDAATRIHAVTGYSPDTGAQLQEVNYLDAFAITLIHENEHRRQYNEWWRGRSDVLDEDGDLVPDDLEPRVAELFTWMPYNLDPTDPNSCQIEQEVETDRTVRIGGEVMTQSRTEWLPLQDDECLAKHAEIVWEVGSACREDWARPGSQWPEDGPSLCRGG